MTTTACPNHHYHKSIDGLLTELAALGVILTAHGDRLQVDAPAGAITPALRARLVEHKAALLAHFASDAQPAQTPVLVRIPLDGLSEYLAEHNLRVVGGTPYFCGTFRPTLFVAAQEVDA